MRAASREAFSTIESHFLSVSFNSACASKYDACMIVSSELLKSCAKERNCLLTMRDIFPSGPPFPADTPSAAEILFMLWDLEGAGIRGTPRTKFNNKGREGENCSSLGSGITLNSCLPRPRQARH